MSTPKRVEVLGRLRRHDGFFRLETITLRHTLFAGGWSRPLEREVLIRGHAVAIIPYDPVRDCVVLVEQFRVGAMVAERDPWLLELPAGFVEEGETSEGVAHRELSEEAGLEALALEPVHEYLVSPGGDCELITLYCARIEAPEEGALHGLAHEGEDIRTHIFPFTEALGAMADGRINSATPLLALQWLQLNRERLRREWV